jgi:hypothetical protein
VTTSNAARFLAATTDLLSECGFQFMVTGSFVSSYYGDPRTTRDLDVVIDAVEPPDEKVVRFVAGCESKGWYVARVSALEPTTRQRRQFNVIDSTTGWKLDVMWRESRAFSESEFARRTPIDLMGVTVFVPTPEDIVLAKLDWTKSIESHQFSDAVSVLKTQRLTIDRVYLHWWARDLGISELLETALRSADG